MSEKMDQKIHEVFETRTPIEMAIGWLRYEALWKLTPREHAELRERNLKGENFDVMVDELVERG
jgi:hypothetical protein